MLVVDLDESAGSTPHEYRYTLTSSIGPYVVRVRIVRDAYLRQSHAVAEVLTPELAWTVLAEDPPGNWWADTASPAMGADAAPVLRPVAERLRSRAAAILAAYSPRPWDGGEPGGSTPTE